MKKKELICSLMLAMLIACPGIARALDLDGAKYEGIAKLAGQPLDYWTVVTFDDEDADFNFANTVKPCAEYTVSGTGNNLTLNLKFGSVKNFLKSTDGGASFSGTMNARDKKVNVWLLKVPSQLIPASQSSEELDKIVGSEDGYTAFLQVSEQGGIMCLPADLTFDIATHGCQMTFDNATFQKMFENLQKCKYSVEGSKITLSSTIGDFTPSGTIYDSGNYIRIPLANRNGRNVTLVLIR